MDLIIALNSINSTKKDEIRTSSSPQAAEKQYPPFPVARSLSYFPDTVLLVNELNIRGLKEFGIDNLRHHDFLLTTIRKGKRFAKWAKPEKSTRIVDILMKKYGYNQTLAAEMATLLKPEQEQKLLALYDEGGKIK